MNQKKQTQKHFLLGVFVFFFAINNFAQTKEKVVTNSVIWATLQLKHDFDSLHHLTLIHQERYSSQKTNFSQTALFQFMYRMDNGFLYQYTPSKKWEIGLQELFVLRINKQQEIFSKFYIGHNSHFKLFSFQKKLHFDWFHPINDSDNPNIIRYDIGRINYDFSLFKKIELKNKDILCPQINVIFFQIAQLNDNTSSPYKNSFFDMIRLNAMLDYTPFPKTTFSIFAMKENRYFGRDDNSSLQIITPTYGFNLKYVW